MRDTFFKVLPGPLRVLIGGHMRGRAIKSLVARDFWRAGPEACWRRFTETLDSLEARTPESGYWLGTSFSVADLALFSMLQSLRLDVTPWQRGVLSAVARQSPNRFSVCVGGDGSAPPHLFWGHSTSRQVLPSKARMCSAPMDQRVPSL